MNLQLTRGTAVLPNILILAREIESPDRAVIATDAAGAVIYWGPGAQLLYGWTEAEALGRDILDVTPGDLSRAEAEEIMTTLRRGRPWRGEFLVRTKDGTKLNAQVTDVPLYDMDGRLAGIIGISRRSSYIAGR